MRRHEQTKQRIENAGREDFYRSMWEVFENSKGAMTLKELGDIFHVSYNTAAVAIDMGLKGKFKTKP